MSAAHHAVCLLQFMNPKMMVKKGGKCPDGHINSWFFEGNGLKEHVSKKLPKQTASKVQFGQKDFKRYPENLLNSRRRYNRAFQVRHLLHCFEFLEACSRVQMVMHYAACCPSTQKHGKCLAPACTSTGLPLCCRYCLAPEPCFPCTQTRFPDCRQLQMKHKVRTC